MITLANITDSDVLPQPLPAPSVARGNLAYPMDAWDFIEYHRCPKRWLLSTPSEIKETVSVSEAMRLFALNSVNASHYYAHRPPTFLYTRLECPICHSSSTSKICRTCGRTRVSVTDTRPWNGSAKYCSAWTLEQEAASRRIINDETWERGIASALSLRNDHAANELLEGAQCQNLLTGIWHDTATNLNIPLRTVLNCIPDAAGNYSDFLCSLSLAEDAHPYAWNPSTFDRSAHMVAALKQELFNTATTQSRHTHAWIVLEKHAPHLISRRASTPDILSAGFSIISAMIASYAQSLSSGIWPGFDSDSHAPSEAFTPCTFEPWMAQAPSGVIPSYPFTVPDAIDA